MKTFVKPHPVDKEIIDTFQFPREEVLKDAQKIRERKIMLERATSMGNTDNTKFKIIFEDSEGLKQVETTIWATGDENIALKYGKNLPIHRIHEVRII